MLLDDNSPAGKAGACWGEKLQDSEAHESTSWVQSLQLACHFDLVSKWRKI
jgi:hypothetical protein